MLYKILSNEKKKIIEKENLNYVNSDDTGFLDDDVFFKYSEICKIKKRDFSDLLFEYAEDRFKEKREVDSEVREKIGGIWKSGLEQLDAIEIICREFSKETFLMIEKEELSEEQEVYINCVKRIHFRSIKIFNEIVCLLRSGYPDGALSLWRSLYEVVTVGKFIIEKGIKCGLEYVNHSSILQLKVVEGICSKTDGKEREFWESLKIKLKEVGDKASANKGKSYKKDYGWAVEFLEKSNNKGGQFTAIEEEVESEYMRAYYKFACTVVHSGATGDFRVNRYTLDSNDFIYERGVKGISMTGKLAANVVSDMTCYIVKLIQGESYHGEGLVLLNGLVGMLEATTKYLGDVEAMIPFVEKDIV